MCRAISGPEPYNGGPNLCIMLFYCKRERPKMQCRRHPKLHCHCMRLQTRISQVTLLSPHTACFVQMLGKTITDAKCVCI